MFRSIAEISDNSFQAVRSTVYDLQIFASGFEERCTHIPKLLHPGLAQPRIVLGFEEHATNEFRKSNDEFYRKFLGSEPVIVPSSKPASISMLMEEHFSARAEECRICIDISSMSRAWYADLINWARFAGTFDKVWIDFCYNTGEYPVPYPPRAISEISSLYGFEGRADLALETVALIGLGYDAITPHAVLEDLQPELTYGYIAGSADEFSVFNALNLNAATINELDGPVAVVPLLSVEAAYSMLCDMIAPHAGKRNVVLVSLGPKTHVLASLLVASRNDEITCLHVRGRSQSASNVGAGRDIAVCSVLFENQECGSATSSNHSDLQLV